MRYELLNGARVVRRWIRSGYVLGVVAVIFSLADVKDSLTIL